MKWFWITYSLTLLSYLAFSISWISFAHTMPALPKIMGTSVCVSVVVVIGLLNTKKLTGRLWPFLLLVPLCVGFWATSVDAIIGLWFHGSVFYMSETTWPDMQILEIVQSGEGYAIYKGIWMVFSFSLINVFNKQKK